MENELKHRINNRKINSIWETECLCQMLPSTIRTADEFIFRFRMTTKYKHTRSESGHFSKPLPRPPLKNFPFANFQLESEWREISTVLWTSQILISMSRWKIGNYSSRQSYSYASSVNESSMRRMNEKQRRCRQRKFLKAKTFVLSNPLPRAPHSRSDKCMHKTKTRLSSTRPVWAFVIWRSRSTQNTHTHTHTPNLITFIKMAFTWNSFIASHNMIMSPQRARVEFIIIFYAQQHCLSFVWVCATRLVPFAFAHTDIRH